MSIVDMTEILKNKKNEQKSTVARNRIPEEADTWKPLEAMEVTRELMESEGVEGCLIVWVTRNGEDEEDKVVNYVMSDMNRDSVMAVLVHALRRVIFEWF